MGGNTGVISPEKMNNQSNGSIMFENVFEVSHPLLKHKLSLLRDKNTQRQQFRALVSEIATIITFEATRDFELTERSIETPLETMNAPVLADDSPVVVPILRAGLGMVDGVVNLLPMARIGHIGLYRDEETRVPHSYYFKIPKNCEDRRFFVCDPMLATGGSAIEAIKQLKAQGVNNITFMCIVAVPEGIEALHRAHPEMPIYTASIDRQLNEHAFIVPGLGDAGDRIFGTL